MVTPSSRYEWKQYFCKFRFSSLVFISIYSLLQYFLNVDKITINHCTIPLTDVMWLKCSFCSKTAPLWIKLLARKSPGRIPGSGHIRGYSRRFHRRNVLDSEFPCKLINLFFFNCTKNWTSFKTCSIIPKRAISVTFKESSCVFYVYQLTCKCQKTISIAVLQSIYCNKLLIYWSY